MMQQVTLIGFGAIGRALYARLASYPGIRISHIVVPKSHALEAGSAMNALNAGVVNLCTQVPLEAGLLVECAGHSAIKEHVLPALTRGTEAAILSIGALCDASLLRQLSDAAQIGGTQVHLLSGAIGGVDAIAAARIAGLDSVTYVGRKPPSGWRGTPAEQVLDLGQLAVPSVIMEGSAREAALHYPKNANVAATIALAGLGLDATRVCLIADPTVKENIHQVEAKGAFGEMSLSLRGKPLADNPKTSALTVLSALRFLHNRAAWVTI